jgi:Xaa-Pro aminopeptidase
MGRIRIPDSEYRERVARAAQSVRERGLDLMVVSGTESDYANVRYFSGFWPLFERAGAVISASGEAALMVGPESRVFASDVSQISKIFVLSEFREPADPAYPELKPDKFADVFAAVGVTGRKLKIGLGSYMDCTLPIYNGLKESYPEAEIIRCDDIMVALRSIKSGNELACIKEGFRIIEIATDEVIKNLTPGVTELQMVGIAQKTVYENGAEYEGLPMYVFSEASTRHAISRPGYRQINKGDIVQLNLSAKVDGYSPSIGLPVGMGKLSAEKKRIAEFCLSAHGFTVSRMKGGRIAGDIARDFLQFYKDNGMESGYVYGPCHGTGMIEVEAPWMETASDYTLQPNMTFQVDTFVSAPAFGVRWEKGVAITEDGCDPMTAYLKGIVEV